MKPLITDMRIKYFLASLAAIPVTAHFMYGTSMFWAVAWVFVMMALINPEALLATIGIHLPEEGEKETENEK